MCNTAAGASNVVCIHLTSGDDDEFDKTVNITNFLQMVMCSSTYISDNTFRKGGNATTTIPIRGTFNKCLQLKGSTSQNFSLNAWKHQPGFGFTNFIVLCHWSRQSHWQCFPFWGITWFVSSDREMSETTSCFHGWWSGWCIDQAVNQPDAWDFAQALVKEDNGHVGKWDCKLIHAVKSQREWSPFHLCGLCTEKRIWLATWWQNEKRLNLHVSKQELDVKYFETFVPVTIQMAICFLFIVVILNCLFLRQVDFVMAYTQAPIEFEMYMTLPQGLSAWFSHVNDFVLHLINNINRNKQV